MKSSFSLIIIMLVFLSMDFKSEFISWFLCSDNAILAPQVGIEPTTCGLTVRRSNRLSYITICTFLTDPRQTFQGREFCWPRSQLSRQLLQ